jgi:hypothetical protein
MNKKLSQFTPAVPAPTDYIAGADVGPPNKKYLISDITALVPLPPPPTPLTNGVSPIVGGSVGKFLVDTGGVLGEADAHFPEATNNIDFYVNPVSGSDSSPDGTNPLTPYATVQRALTEAARYNWSFQFFWRIHLADGTYSQANQGNNAIQIGSFVNLFLPGEFIANPANPQNVVLAVGFALQFGDGSIILGGLSFTGVTIGSCVNCIEGLISISDPIIFNDNVQSCFYNEAHAFTFCNATITVNASHVNWFGFAAPGCLWFSNPTVHFPVGGFNADQSFFECDGLIGNNGIEVAQIIWGGPTLTNAGGVTGTQLTSYQFGYTLTQHGSLADIPGNGGLVTFDSSAVIAGFNGAFGTTFQSKSGPPTTTDIPVPGTSRIMGDTSSGGGWAAMNVGGVIKKVAMV